MFPFIKFTQIYNDDHSEKYERPIYILPESIDHFAPFEIGYGGESFNVKEDDKEIIKKITSKLKEMEEYNKLHGVDDDDE